MSKSKATETVTQHTPAPWRVEHDEADVYVLMDALGGEEDDHLLVYAADRTEKPEQRLADARLIAAAPDLLRLLDEAVAALEAENTQTALLQDEIRAAIAKARGE